MTAARPNTWRQPASREATLPSWSRGPLRRRAAGPAPGRAVGGRGRPGSGLADDAVAGRVAELLDAAVVEAQVHRPTTRPQAGDGQLREPVGQRRVDVELALAVGRDARMDAAQDRDQAEDRRRRPRLRGAR